MTCRIATRDDYAIVKHTVDKLIKDSKYNSLFSTFSLTDIEFEEYVHYGSCALSFDEDKLVGLAAWGFMPLVDKLAARLVAIYVDPEYRKTGRAKELMDIFEYWGKANGCQVYYVGVSTGHDLTKLGYDPFEVVYMKEVV